MYLYHSLISLCLLFASSISFGASSILLNGTSLVADNYEYFIDSSGNLTFQEITSSSRLQQFRPMEDKAHPSRVCWLKFSIANNSKMEQEYLLDMENWHKVDLYYSNNGKQFKIKKTGHVVPFLKKDYPNGNKNLILLTVKKDEHLSCFLRLEYTDHYFILPQKITFKIIPKSEFLENETDSRFITGTFLGIFIIMLIYNFFIWISTKDKSYIFYLMLLLLASYGVFHSIGTMYGFQELKFFVGPYYAFRIGT
jgi:hypothetical protein